MKNTYFPKVISFLYTYRSICSCINLFSTPVSDLQLHELIQDFRLRSWPLLALPPKSGESASEY